MNFFALCRGIVVPEIVSGSSTIIVGSG